MKTQANSKKENNVSMLTRKISVAGILIGMIMGLTIAEWSWPMPVKANRDYTFEKKDKAQEQKKYVQKLSQDKKKIDLSIKTTKILLDRSHNKPYLPELYLRLAELYIEKSRVVHFIRKSQVQGKLKTLDKLESRSLKNQAVEIYQQILADFPDFPDQDKVRFFMAHEYRELGQLKDMADQYRLIIEKYEKSAYVPESCLLLGDYYMNLPDMENALKQYQKVLNFPDSSAISIARYKLGWVQINQGNFKEALLLFEACVKSPNAQKKLDVDTYKRVDIRLEALMDMAYCYPEVYKQKTASDAISYFYDHAWSRPVFESVMEKLAYRYYIKKRWEIAAPLYRELSDLSNDPDKLLMFARHIYDCARVLGTFQSADKDMEIIVKALFEQKYSVFVDEKEKQKNIKDFELYARDIATHLHNLARTRNDDKDFSQAALAYEQYLDFFKQSPVLWDMQANYAETLFKAKQFIKAGKQYELLARHYKQQGSQKGSQEQDMLYSAVISYYNALKNKETLNTYEKVYARTGLKQAGNLFVTEFPSAKMVPDVLFNIAWITYDEGKYDQAIARLSQFVNKYPQGKEAKAAVHLILDAFHMKEDYEGLAAYGRQVLQSNVAQIDKDGKFRADILNIVKASEAKIVSSLTVSAVDDWEKGREDFIQFIDKTKLSEVGEQALTALLASSRTQGDFKTLFISGSKLIEKYPGSPKVEDTLTLMIDFAVKSSQFRLLAEYLETYARVLPKHKNSPDFIVKAGQIRKGLNQYGIAAKDFMQALSAYDDHKDLVKTVLFDLADCLQSTGNIDLAITYLFKYGKKLADRDKAKAQIMAANLYFNLNEPKKAFKYRKYALKKFKPEWLKSDTALDLAYTEMQYNALKQTQNTYMALTLKTKLDNKVVSRKANYLKTLEEGYHSVISRKHPKWALKAIYESYLANAEFARFLRQAPLPELSADQKEQYISMLEKKAAAYDNKAAQYQKAYTDQSQKWTLCMPGWKPEAQGKSGLKQTFGVVKEHEIASECLEDDTLLALHHKLTQQTDNLTLLSELMQAYLERGDYSQSILIGQKILTEHKDIDPVIKSKIYSELGFALMAVGKDQAAKDALNKAVIANYNENDAKINLVGLYHFYGYMQQARQMIDSIPTDIVSDELKNKVHPKAMEIFNEYRQKLKNG